MTSTLPSLPYNLHSRLVRPCIRDLPACHSTQTADPDVRRQIKLAQYLPTVTHRHQLLNRRTSPNHNPSRFHDRDLLDSVCGDYLLIQPNRSERPFVDVHQTSPACADVIRSSRGSSEYPVSTPPSWLARGPEASRTQSRYKGVTWS